MVWKNAFSRNMNLHKEMVYYSKPPWLRIYQKLTAASCVKRSFLELADVQQLFFAASFLFGQSEGATGFAR